MSFPRAVKELLQKFFDKRYLVKGSTEGAQTVSEDTTFSGLVQVSNTSPILRFKDTDSGNPECDLVMGFGQASIRADTNDVIANSRIDFRVDGSEKMRIDASGYIYIYNIRSGSTQANAGASANELWKTNGHATLPDNVVMIGV